MLAMSSVAPGGISMTAVRNTAWLYDPARKLPAMPIMFVAPYLAAEPDWHYSIN